MLIIAAALIAVTAGIFASTFLAITPITGAPGICTLAIYWPNGTPMNASDFKAELYICNYSAVDNNNWGAYTSNFSNYELAAINITENPTEIEINESTVVLALIYLGNKSNNAPHKWVQLIPGEVDVVLGYYADNFDTQSIWINASDLSNAEINQYISLNYTAPNDNIYLPYSIEPIDNPFSNLYLVLKIDNPAGNYTDVTLDLDYSDEKVENGDLYIKLNTDLYGRNVNEFHGYINMTAIGNPSITIGYTQWTNCSSEFVEIAAAA